MISPLVFGFAARGGSFVWVSLVVGAVIMMFGIARLVSPEKFPFLSWTNFVVGACMLLSPWMFGFESNETRMWTDAVAGGYHAACSSERENDSADATEAFGCQAGATFAITACRSRGGTPTAFKRYIDTRQRVAKW